MKARDVMTSTVVSVDADTPTGEIARRLLEHHISAVPVLDKSGAPIGMVSEGDLIGRNETDRVARRDWWLTVMTGKQPLDDDFCARVAAKDRTAREVMSNKSFRVPVADTSAMVSPATASCARRSRRMLPLEFSPQLA